MTTTETGAFEAMLAHHAALAGGVSRRVDVLHATVEAGGSYESAAGELMAYMAREVLPHALAEEHTVYRAAAGDPAMEETVSAMIDEHRQLAASTERLATAPEGQAAAAEADSLGGLFAAHVAKENEVMLPALAKSSSVDLAALLIQMHRLTEAAQDDTPTVQSAVTPDTEARLVQLLVEATRRLADAGRGDAASRVAAQAWAAVHVPRPDLAVRVTSALHRLVPSVTAQPVRLSSGSAAASPQGDAILDVRALAPAQRHEQIFATYGALGPGRGFVLVNDHDPRPLRYQFEAEQAGRFTWDELEAGPTVWRVRIGRPALANN